MAYEINEKVWERASKKMNRKQFELAKKLLEYVKKTGDQKTWDQFVQLVAEVDPGASREIGARTRR